MKNIATFFGIMLFFSTIFVPNISYAGGGGAAAAAGGMADTAHKSQKMAAEMMSRGGINSKVFQKADEFLKERFSDIYVNGEWSANTQGFMRPNKAVAAGRFAILRWNGQLEVFDCGIWNCTVLYKGDWTKWLK